MKTQPHSSLPPGPWVQDGAWIIDVRGNHVCHITRYGCDIMRAVLALPQVIAAMQSTITVLSLLSNPRLSHVQCDLLTNALREAGVEV